MRVFRTFPDICLYSMPILMQYQHQLSTCIVEQTQHMVQSHARMATEEEGGAAVEHRLLVITTA